MSSGMWFAQAITDFAELWLFVGAVCILAVGLVILGRAFLPDDEDI